MTLLQIGGRAYFFSTPTRISRGYLRTLLDAWFERNPIGVVIGAPFVMRTEAAPAGRQPDLRVILESNAGDLTDTAMIGAADVCVEVVSAESVDRDYGEKLAEYEHAGVREYWLIDPIRSQALFHRLTLDGTYAPRKADGNGNYATTILPGFVLHVPTLWRTPLPRFSAIGRAVDAMFAG